MKPDFGARLAALGVDFGDVRQDHSTNTPDYDSNFAGSLCARAPEDFSYEFSRQDGHKIPRLRNGLSIDEWLEHLCKVADLLRILCIFKAEDAKRMYS